MTKMQCCCEPGRCWGLGTIPEACPVRGSGKKPAASFFRRDSIRKTNTSVLMCFALLLQARSYLYSFHCIQYDLGVFVRDKMACLFGINFDHTQFINTRNIPESWLWPVFVQVSFKIILKSVLQFSFTTSWSFIPETEYLWITQFYLHLYFISGAHLSCSVPIL